MTMLRIFWDAARRLDAGVRGERYLAGTADGDIARRFEQNGLEHVIAGALTARAEYSSFDDFWEPFTFCVGPAGQYLRALPAEQQHGLREACRELLPDGKFSLDARAWCARGIVAVPKAATR